MAIQVKSEIGRLKKVMLHRPGKELEHLVPGDLERLLFDDIPYLKAAQNEHDLFAGILREQGVEVTYLEDLTAEVLKNNAELKEQFIHQFIEEGDVNDARVKESLAAFLMEIPDEKELVKKMMSGVRDEELNIRTKGPLSSLLNIESQFLLDPIPNFITLVAKGLNVM